MIDQKMTRDLEYLKGRLEAEGFLKVAEEFGMSVIQNCSSSFKVVYNYNNMAEWNYPQGLSPETLPSFMFYCIRIEGSDFLRYVMKIKTNMEYQIDFKLDGVSLKEFLRHKIPELIRFQIMDAIGNSMKGLPYKNLYQSAYALNVMLQRFNEVMTENGR